MDNLTEDIARVSRDLILKGPFYGLYLLGLNKEVSTRIKAACVSKRGINTHLTINPEFWVKLKPKHKIAVFKHEILHIIFFHLMIGDELPDRELRNIAADLEVNQYIEDDLKEGWEGLELDTFPELNLPEKVGTRKYYELLKKSVNKGISPALDELYNSMKGGLILHVSHEDWKEFEGMSDAEKNAVKAQIEHKLKEVANEIRSRGNIPSELSSLINALFVKHEPVIDWKKFVRRFAGLSQKVITKKSRRKLNKRFIDLPGLKIKPKRLILVATDTSGSVKDEELMEFWNEIDHIWRSGTAVTVVECDADVHRYFEYNGIIPDRVTGRGGTDFQPIIDFLFDHRKKYSLLIVLTDGACGAPTKPCKPTLWVISSGGKAQETFPGKTIQIKR